MSAHVIKKLKELRTIISKMSPGELVDLFNSVEVDPEAVKSYALLERSLIASAELRNIQSLPRDGRLVPDTSYRTIQSDTTGVVQAACRWAGCTSFALENNYYCDAHEMSKWPNARKKRKYDKPSRP